MTELDLDLKVASRRMLWRMGFTTRVDVPLRAVPNSASTTEGLRAKLRAPESFTDLDVLGIAIAPGFKVQSAIVDCKTGGASAISRMFWVRGLADFFKADTAYMVREREISKGARQLAGRLNIVALTGEEVSALEALHSTVLPIQTAPLSLLFDRKHVAIVFERFASQDKKLKLLLDYRQFDYWVYDDYLNLVQVVEHLRGANKTLDGKNAQHLSIVLDCAWLYLLSLSHALESIRSVHVSHFEYGLQEYMMGGAARLREKEQLSALLADLQEAGQVPKTANVDPLPTYFSSLLELSTRVLRRNDVVVSTLRYLEFLSSMAMAGVRVGARKAFGFEYDEITAKIAENVVAFLVESAQLDGRFLVLARELLFGEPDAEASSSEPISPASQVEASDATQLELEIPSYTTRRDLP